MFSGKGLSQYFGFGGHTACVGATQLKHQRSPRQYVNDGCGCVSMKLVTKPGRGPDLATSDPGEVKLASAGKG